MTSFLVCLDHFEILRSIGRGSFGKVSIITFCYNMQFTGIHFAVYLKIPSPDYNVFVTLEEDLCHTTNINLIFKMMIIM